VQFVHYTDGTGPTWGIKDGESIHSLGALPRDKPTLRDIGNANYRSELTSLIQDGALPEVELSEVSLLAPVRKPGKIVCCGLNYHDHAEEQDESVPEQPMLFAKAPTAVADPGEQIVHPAPDGEAKVDYEVELGVIIGQTGKSLSESEAYEHIAGYTVLNDVSERVSQKADGQFFRGKSYDTFAPMGPTLVASEEFDPNAVEVEMRVDGDVRQSSNTDQFIFDVGELVSYISDAMTLKPGDVISTGTPGGVGIFREPEEVLEVGQTTKATIEGIGTLTNTVARAETADA
jgi:2-keto-4-pentenoate hydratase/2-oxohepta-3-ene-1,7-dioic acid hydratase in catechol pathway